VSGPGALFLAFAAGLLSFLLPCTLPLLPGYLSYISGLAAEEVQARENRNTVVGAASLFVLGFSLVFVALGATLSYIGSLLMPYRLTLLRVSGIFIVVMALFIMGLFRLPVLYAEKRFHLRPNIGIWSALPLGMAFAFGWTPCVGPVLTSILALATTQGTEQKGALLLFVYSLGLGVPFLALALFAGRVMNTVKRFGRYYLALNLGGGAVLLVMGTLLILNRWTELMAPMLRWYADHPLPI
jgi:cytochrome c-type biogenesis protein